jgi:hypothetical protein
MMVSWEGIAIVCGDHVVRQGWLNWWLLEGISLPNNDYVPGSEVVKPARTSPGFMGFRPVLMSLGVECLIARIRGFSLRGTLETLAAGPSLSHVSLRLISSILRIGGAKDRGPEAPWIEVDPDSRSVCP